MSRLIVSPCTACAVAVVLAVIMTTSVLWSATHHRVDTRIDPCAMVLTKDHGPRCLP